MFSEDPLKAVPQTFPKIERTLNAIVDVEVKT